MERRVFENPLIKDKVTLLKSSEETNGAYTLVEVELQAGGGNDLHYHTSFTEEFTAVEGTVSIGFGKSNMHLKPGEKALARINQLHRFYNAGNSTIRFEVKLVPGAVEFEKGLAIGYGLASDGHTNKHGIPKKLDHLAVLLDLTNTRLTGIYGLIIPFLLYRAKKARKKGILADLENRYWHQTAPKAVAAKAATVNA